MKQARVFGTIDCAPLVLACSSDKKTGGMTQVAKGKCQLGADAPVPEMLQHIGCTGDFQALASQPIDVDLPGARSVKVVLDTRDDDALYFKTVSAVSASAFRVREATQDEEDAYWKTHRPTPVSPAALDLSIQGLYDIEDVTPETSGVRLRDALGRRSTSHRKSECKTR